MALITSDCAPFSRMTIGMLIESMAGKAGSLHGLFHNSTPFMYNENERCAAQPPLGHTARAMQHDFLSAPAASCDVAYTCGSLKILLA